MYAAYHPRRPKEDSQVTTNKHHKDKDLLRPPQLQTPQHRQRQQQHIQVNNQTPHRTQQLLPQLIHTPFLPSPRRPLHTYRIAREQAHELQRQEPPRVHGDADPEEPFEGALVQGYDAPVEEEGGGADDGYGDAEEEGFYEESLQGVRARCLGVGDGS